MFSVALLLLLVVVLLLLLLLLLLPFTCVRLRFLFAICRALSAVVVALASLYFVCACN